MTRPLIFDIITLRYDRDNSGKYKIKRINPPKKGGKAAKGIKSDYCVDMMAFILDAWGLGDVGTGTETSGGGRHIHLLAPKGVNTKELKKHLHEFKFKNEEGSEGNALEFLREGNYVLTVGVTEYDDGSKRYHTLPNGIDPLDKDNMPEATQVMIDALSQSRNPESKAPTHHNANGTHAVSDAFSNLDDPNSVEPTAEQINSIKFNTYPQKTPEQVRLILEKVKGWDEYHKWIDVGHALKHWANESDGDMDAEAFALFDEWSRQSKTEYDKADCRKTWEGFKPHDSNPITLGSLIAEIEDDCTPDEIAAIKHTDPAHIKWARLDTIKTQVPEVQALGVDMIPESLRPWLADVSHRMQSPVDFVAVSAITVIGSVVGAGCGMRPKAVDNWEVTPNLNQPLSYHYLLCYPKCFLFLSA
jgi:hypothetical protein